MIAFLTAWAICATVASFIVLALVVGTEVVRHHRTKATTDRPVPQIPEQRQPTSAAVIVEVVDAQSFDEFLLELILTPHIEEVLS